MSDMKEELKWLRGERAEDIEFFIIRTLEEISSINSQLESRPDDYAWRGGAASAIGHKKVLIGHAMRYVGKSKVAEMSYLTGMNRRDDEIKELRGTLKALQNNSRQEIESLKAKLAKARMDQIDVRQAANRLRSRLGPECYQILTTEKPNLTH